RLDDGDVVLQRTVRGPHANPAQLRSRLLEDAVPAVAELIDVVRRDGFGAIPRTPQRGGRYFTTPSWCEWRAYRKATERRCCSRAPSLLGLFWKRRAESQSHGVS